MSYSYDATNKLTSRALPNGVAASYTYDGMDRLTRLKDAKGNTVIADNQYSYNNASDITQNIDQSGTHSYGYDTMDRLISATYPATTNESYAYDGVGNRISSHKSATYGYQPNNRLVSTNTATYIYNNNGNLVSKTEGTGTTQYVWDFENRLTQVVTPASGSVTYKYDGLGRRIQRTPSSGVSTNFVYDGQDVVKDINSDGTTVEYLNGPGIDNKIRQKSSSTSTTDHTSFDPKKSMDMAHATFDSLQAFGRRNGCECDGAPDWKVVQEFIDVGYSRRNPAGFGDMTDDQLRRKIQLLGVPWRSASGY